MSFLFSARQIVEKSLRKIGAFSINDSAADGVEIAEGLGWLDMIMGELAGADEIWWLVENTVTIPLTAAQASYDLSDLLSVDVQFPKFAQLDTGSNNRTPVRLITRREYEENNDLTTSGDPDSIHIDRLQVPTMKVYPVPALTGRSILLTYQGFAANIATKVGGSAAHGLNSAWQLWATNALAAQLGDGPIRRMQDRELNGFRAQAAVSKADLLGFQAVEHDNDSPISSSSDCV